MAFWKKSDDPWDRKPGKQKETLWREQEAPVENDSPVERELTPKEQRIRDIIEGPKVTPVVPEKCPWCGGDMEAASIYSERGWTVWKLGDHGGGMFDSAAAMTLQEEGISFWDRAFKRSWYCRACEKMTLSVKMPKASHYDSNSFADYARQWKEMEEREKEEQRKKQE
ncbi:MAG: hypothetical protein IJZ66_08340 [Oscillibacter sp.]|nr:hypothetical protein [Oscillibacter sp.]